MPQSNPFAVQSYNPRTKALIYSGVAAGGAGVLVLSSAQSAQAQAVDPAALITAGMTSLTDVVGVVIGLGVTVLIASVAFGVVRRII